MAKKNVTAISENQFKVKFYADLAKEKGFINGNAFQKKFAKEGEQAWKDYQKLAKAGE